MMMLIMVMTMFSQEARRAATSRLGACALRAGVALRRARCD